MEEIKQWLNSEQNYNTGLLLLQKYSKNRVLKENLAKKKHPRKLRYELAKIARVQAKPAKKQKKKKQSQPDSQQQAEAKMKTIIDKKQINYDALPSDIKALYDETVKVYKKQRSLHEKLKILEKQGADDTAKVKITYEIAGLDELIRENWAKIDNWDPNSEQEKQGKKQESEQKQLTHKQIGANRKYISSNKSKIKDDPEKWIPKIQQRVDELLASGEDFKQELKDELRECGIRI